MSNQRIANQFAKLQTNHEHAFIPFLVVGDPTPDLFIQLIKAIEPFSDVIELGIPFSDPIADGPVIQNANQRVLSQGISVNKVIELIGQVRSLTVRPIVLLTYANVIGVTETSRNEMLSALAKAGVDGIIIADVPTEESFPFKQDLNKVGMDLIYLAAPTTKATRLEKIAENACGYLYLVSVKGTTGARTAVLEETAETIRRVTSALKARKGIKIPVCVGFGISTPDHVKEILKLGADGAIVGSAIIKIIENLREKPTQMLQTISKFVQEMKNATKGQI